MSRINDELHQTMSCTKTKKGRRLKIERSGKYLISVFITSSLLFLFWCKEFWIITLIILLIVYILGKSKQLCVLFWICVRIISYVIYDTLWELSYIVIHATLWFVEMIIFSRKIFLNLEVLYCFHLSKFREGVICDCNKAMHFSFGLNMLQWL